MSKMGSLNTIIEDYSITEIEYMELKGEINLYMKKELPFDKLSFKAKRIVAEDVVRMAR